MKIKHFLLLIHILLYVSCGPQQQAESVIEDFMMTNLKDATTLNIIEYGKLDSTRYLNDSIIDRLCKTAKESALYKDNIHFSDKKNGNKLMILRVKYQVNGKEHHATYYLSEDFTKVIALKNN